MVESVMVDILAERSASTPDAKPAGTRLGDPTLARGLQIVSALLNAEVARMRASGIPVGENEYRGLYISEPDVDRLLGTPRRAVRDNTAVAQDDRFSGPRTELAQLAASADGPLGRIVCLANLGPFEVGTLLLCLAADEDPDVQRLIAYAQDHVSRWRPSVELLTRILLGDDAQGAARRAFDSGAPLRRWRLVTLHDEPGQPHTPAASRSVALEPRVAAHLLGDVEVDEILRSHSRLTDGPAGACHPALPTPLRERIHALSALPATMLRPPTLHLSGPDPLRTRMVAGELAAGARLGLLSVDLPALESEVGLDTALALSGREAALQDAALFLAGVDRLKRGDIDRLRTLALDGFFAPLTFLATSGEDAWPGLSIAVPALDFDARRYLWETALGDGSTIQPGALDDLAGKFRLSIQGIEDAARAALGAARWRDPVAPVIGLTDLYEAARAQSMPILNTLARKIVPHYGWDDIVLPTDTFDQLHEMCGMVEHRHLVYEAWGFDRKLALGKGVIALFAGSSGTGKTMAADVIAGALGLDLYKIDLSGVVSKYIGETEKNLGSIFSEAESSNAILFFDEADALFGKRSEVKDAHDRYANIETAYLLQRMEEYSGAVILATNLKMNLDEAFSRRLHFVVDFPLPDEEDRRRIWISTLPTDLPRAADIDFNFLARQFKFTGGNIRNIVLAGAFIAAGDGVPMGMTHLIRATRREYQKLGRMVTEAEFGSYTALLRGS